MRGHPEQRGNEGWRIKVYVGAPATAASAMWSGRCAAPSAKPSELARLVVEVDEGRHAASAPPAWSLDGHPLPRCRSPSPCQRLPPGDRGRWTPAW